MQKNYTDDQLKENYNKFITTLKVVFEKSPLRRDLLLNMYGEDELGINLTLSPACTAPHFGNAYEGGYIDYVNLVCKLCLNKQKTLHEVGDESTIVNFTNEELLFVAINHAVGKLGIAGSSLYIPNDSDWHIQNKMEYFKTNSEIYWMKPSDRSLFLLQKYEIRMSENEYLAIMLQDGLYNRHNEDYLFRYTPDSMVQTMLPNVLHQAIQEAFYIQRTI